MASAAVVLSNWLNLKLNDPKKVTVGFCDNAGVIETPKPPQMIGDLEMVLNTRFSGVTTAAIWESISAAKNSAGAIATGITYIVKTTRGSTPKNYLGKTIYSLAKRYPKGPDTGGLGAAFAEYEKGNASMDVTLYWTTNPSLVEGWCYAIALSQHIALENVMDPG